MIKRFSLILLIGVAIVMAAASAEAQCFDCVQQSGSNPDRPNMYCRSPGYDFSSCTTISNFDPNTCTEYTTCGNAYTCVSDGGGGGGYCSNSSCDSTHQWDINSIKDMYGYYCYHYATYCEYVK